MLNRLSWTKFLSSIKENKKMSKLLWTSCLFPNTSSSLSSEAWISELEGGHTKNYSSPRWQMQGSSPILTEQAPMETAESGACPPHLPHAPLSIVWQSPTAPHRPLPGPATLADPSENSQVIQAHSSYIISIFSLNIHMHPRTHNQTHSNLENVSKLRHTTTRNMLPSDSF